MLTPNQTIQIGASNYKVTKLMPRERCVIKLVQLEKTNDLKVSTVFKIKDDWFIVTQAKVGKGIYVIRLMSLEEIKKFEKAFHEMKRQQNREDLLQQSSRHQPIPTEPASSTETSYKATPLIESKGGLLG